MYYSFMSVKPVLHCVSKIRTTCRVVLLSMGQRLIHEKVSLHKASLNSKYQQCNPVTDFLTKEWSILGNLTSVIQL